MSLLYTFAISHFSEKARWGLDAAGVAYTEKMLLPGPHVLVTRRLAPRSEVPILRHGSRVIQGSGAILDFIEGIAGQTAVYTPEEMPANEIERRADEAFGRGIQRIFYDVLLRHRGVVTGLWLQHGPRWGPAVYALTYPLLARAIRRGYHIEPGRVRAAQDEFRRLFDELDVRLSRSDYLLGPTVSRLDRSVSALLAPLVRPPEHLLDWPAFPAELVPFVREFENRPTWSHVLRMYREHRREGQTNPGR
jgi:glutathione S-transferase